MRESNVVGHSYDHNPDWHGLGRMAGAENMQKTCPTTLSEFMLLNTSPINVCEVRESNVRQPEEDRGCHHSEEKSPE